MICAVWQMQLITESSRRVGKKKHKQAFCYQRRRILNKGKTVVCFPEEDISQWLDELDECWRISLVCRSLADLNMNVDRGRRCCSTFSLCVFVSRMRSRCSPNSLDRWNTCQGRSQWNQFEIRWASVKNIIFLHWIWWMQSESSTYILSFHKRSHFLDGKETTMSCISSIIVLVSCFRRLWYFLPSTSRQCLRLVSVPSSQLPVPQNHRGPMTPVLASSQQNTSDCCLSPGDISDLLVTYDVVT